VSLAIRTKISIAQFFRNAYQSGKPNPINSSYFACIQTGTGFLCITFKQQSHKSGVSREKVPGLTDLA
jgi:hypothetical protein